MEMYSQPAYETMRSEVHSRSTLFKTNAGLVFTDGYTQLQTLNKHSQLGFTQYTGLPRNIFLNIRRHLVLVQVSW